jgi:hypothetical protein
MAQYLAGAVIPEFVFSGPKIVNGSETLSVTITVPSQASGTFQLDLQASKTIIIEPLS